MLMRRLRYWIESAKRRRSLREEMDLHIGEKTAELRNQGLSEPDAETEARRRFGNVARTAEDVRDVWTLAWLDQLGRDIRFSLRALKKSPGYTAVAILSIAVGIGATTAVFSIVDNLLLKPPPAIEDPDEILAIYLDNRSTPDVDYQTFAYPQFEEFDAAQNVFADLAAYSRLTMVATTESDSSSVITEFVSGGYFSTFGVRPTLGRMLLPEDNVPSAPLVTVLSYDFWQSRFGADPDVVGKSFRLSGRPAKIIGVASQGFIGVVVDWYPRPALWVSVHSYTPLIGTNRVTRRTPWTLTLGRLKPGVTFEMAQAQMDSVVRSITVLPDDIYQPDAIDLLPIHKAKLRPGRRGQIVKFFSLLMVVSALILLAACFNVANFLLGQGAARRREVAVRLAMGATRADLIRQFLRESMLLALLSTIAGVALSVWLSAVFSRFPRMFRLSGLYVEAPLDLRILAFALLMAVLTTLIFGLLPALLVSGRDPSSALKEFSTTWNLSGFKLKPRQLMLVGQVALALVLAVTAGLYARTLRNMTSVELRFQTENILLMKVDPSSMTPEEGANFYRRLLPAFHQVPGVESAAAANWQPVSGGRGVIAMMVPGRDEYFRFVEAIAIASNYFHTYRIPILSGREFEFDSRADVSSSIVVNDLMAMQLWPGENAIGKVVRTRRSQGVTERQVIGVVDLDKCSDIIQEPSPCVFNPIALDNNGTRISVRTAADPMTLVPALRSIIRNLGVDVAVDEIRTFQDHLGERTSGQRVAAMMTSLLAGIGIVLVAIGCFALFSSMIRESTFEIALRMALGATSGNLIAQVLRRAIALSAVGILVGLVVSVFINRQLADQLYNTSPSDTATLILAASAIAFIGVVSSYLPARGIAQTDPATALKGPY